MLVRICIFCFALLAAPVFSQELALPGSTQNPKVQIETSQGRIVLELFTDKAPLTANNFLTYALAGHYNGTIIHRISKDFVVQGGAYTVDLRKKTQRGAITLETSTGLKNLRGTIAAARKQTDVNSATSEFFINLVDNPQLDFQSKKTPANEGFAVFGQIIEGMAVIDKIRNIATTSKPGFPELPTSPVTIISVTRLPE